MATVIARTLEFVIFEVLYVRTKPEFAVKAVDSLLTLFVMIPMVIILGRYMVIGPVGMYGCVKLIDLIKVAVFHVC